MDDRVFDLETVHEAIHRVCDVFDELEMTLDERFYTLHSLATSAAALLGRKYNELAEMIERDYPDLAEKARENEEKPAE